MTAVLMRLPRKKTDEKTAHVRLRRGPRPYRVGIYLPSQEESWRGLTTPAHLFRRTLSIKPRHDPVKTDSVRAASEEMRPAFAEVQKAVKPYREADQLVAYEYGDILSRHLRATALGTLSRSYRLRVWDHRRQHPFLGRYGAVPVGLQTWVLRAAPVVTESAGSVFNGCSNLLWQ